MIQKVVMVISKYIQYLLSYTVITFYSGGLCRLLLHTGRPVSKLPSVETRPRWGTHSHGRIPNDYCIVFYCVGLGCILLYCVVFCCNALYCLPL